MQFCFEMVQISFYYKMSQFFYSKTRQLLQVATILLQNATIITKYDVYYKLPQYPLDVVF